MSRVLVTGGAGFIGRRLVNRLLADHHDVLIYDSLVSPNSRRPQENKHLSFMEAGLLDKEALYEATKGIDCVFHLAANTSVRAGSLDPDLDFYNGLVATFNVLEAMKLNGVKHLYFTSSSAIYGDVPSVVLNEAHGLPMPISSYGACKLAAENIISAYGHLYGIKSLIFRLANIVGPDTKQGVIYNFIHELRRNPKELEVLADGRQEKPYLHVDDCVRGILHPKFYAQCSVFNLGCRTTTTVNGIARIVADEMHLNGVRLRHTGGKSGWPGDVPKYCLDIGKIEALGWKPSFTSDNAVRVAARQLILESEP